MAKNSQTLKVAEANRAYFVVLARTRASLSSLSGMAFTVAIVLGLDTFIGLNAIVFFEGARQLIPLFWGQVVAIGLISVLGIIAMFKSLTFRFQTFFSSAMAGVAGLLVYSICMLALVLASFDGATGKRLSPLAFAIEGSATGLLLLGAIAVHVILLNRRLRLGHSEKRIFANLLAVSGAGRARTFWIALGLAAIVIPNVLTQGRFLVPCIGLIMLIFFICFTTSLPVEFGYLAYLKSKDRDYWERRPRPLPRRERLLRARKVVIWVLGIAAALALFWVLAKYVL